MTDEIRLTMPAQEDFHPVAHLVVGGLGARRELTFEDLEDMQVALDALLTCREDEEDVTVLLCVENDELRATVGPFDRDALARLDDSPTGLAPRRILETVCDSVTVEDSFVRLTKQVAG